MVNTDIKVDGDKLIITVDLSKDYGPSKSGKTHIVATTQGNVSVGDVKLGLNVYRSRN
jgi:hypothetical protein